MIKLLTFTEFGYALTVLCQLGHLSLQFQFVCSFPKYVSKMEWQLLNKASITKFQFPYMYIIVHLSFRKHQYHDMGPTGQKTLVNLSILLLAVSSFLSCIITMNFIYHSLFLQENCNSIYFIILF